MNRIIKIVIYTICIVTIFGCGKSRNFDGSVVGSKGPYIDDNRIDNQTLTQKNLTETIIQNMIDNPSNWTFSYREDIPILGYKSIAKADQENSYTYRHIKTCENKICGIKIQIDSAIGYCYIRKRIGDTIERPIIIDILLLSPDTLRLYATKAINDSLLKWIPKIENLSKIAKYLKSQKEDSAKNAKVELEIIKKICK